MTALTTINLHTNYEKLELVHIYDRLLLPAVPILSSVSVGSSGSSGILSQQSSSVPTTARYSPGHMNDQGTSMDTNTP